MYTRAGSELDDLDHDLYGACSLYTMACFDGGCAPLTPPPFPQALRTPNVVGMHWQKASLRTGESQDNLRELLKKAGGKVWLRLTHLLQLYNTNVFGEIQLGITLF